PHFCYHKKLSIAANCRMCLVEVEKAPKALPACATPVTPGMKVWTRSEKAIAAQKAVMEFLLINHPLDCPICDQGGECQLQDLAVGYGSSSSRYDEAKRVVFHKPMGPLISAEEMSRCIHCTRCVRFGQEVAGVMELGMAGRGQHSEIMSFVGRSVESEVSGNMIDICPVGALTSKPFRYSARTWELSRRRSVSPHDSLGSTLNIQVKHDRVMRVVPFEQEAVNECWISDRDRFSYEGLNSPDRLTVPMVKDDHGVWHEVEWKAALETAANRLRDVAKEPGGLGVLAAASSTLEELALAARLGRALGTDSIDHRVRQHDFSIDPVREGAPWLGMPVAAVDGLQRLFLIGGLLRNDSPLLSVRVRKAAGRGAQISILQAVGEDPLMPLHAQVVLAPSQWITVLHDVARLVAEKRSVALPEAFSKLVGSVPEQLDITTLAVRIADSLTAELAESATSTVPKAIWLGQGAMRHAQAAAIHQLAAWIAQQCGATLGVVGDSANSVGAWLAGCVPLAGGLNAQAMLEHARRGYLLVNLEPQLDSSDPFAFDHALSHAETVVALSAYRSEALLARSHVLLPVTPFTETSGTYVSCEGRAQSFNGVVKPQGDARPGWKVLRVLGSMFGAPGFDSIDRSEQVRDDVLGGQGLASTPRHEAEPLRAGLNNGLKGSVHGSAQATAHASAYPTAHASSDTAAHASQLERIAELPLYSVDGIVRRSDALQATRAARTPQALVSSVTLAALGLAAGDEVLVAHHQQSAQPLSALPEAGARLTLAVDDRLPSGCVRVDGGHPSTVAAGAWSGVVTVTRA
ncbi:MAG: NADH-quinone oxidoreductase subunit G, partial [Betaproteobacteria bacterium]|nr:NADH-quinone oxidoreductase subunit G [Betaproteobacteria bacterium]